MDESVEWMRFLCMTIYMCVCVIFQFKTGVTLKRGCVEPLLQSYFWRLGKITKNRSILFSAVRKKPPKIVTNNFWWFVK
jgi:hypothetical protein